MKTKLLWYGAVGVTLLAILMGGFAGLWLPFVWFLVPFGIILGSRIPTDKIETYTLATFVAFIVSGQYLSEMFAGIAYVGVFFSLGIDSFVVFLTSATVVYGFRYVWKVWTT